MIDFIKINLIIRFACVMNGTEPPVYVVIEPWIYRFWLSAPDCEHRVNRSNVTCWIYYTHISSGMYGGLKPLHTTMSFQPYRPLSLVYFLVFFYALYQKSCNLLPLMNFIWVDNKLDFKIYFLKKKYCIVFDVT
jgi:hypothetical protein